MMIMFQRDDSPVFEKDIRAWVIKLARGLEKIYITKEKIKNLQLQVF